MKRRSLVIATFNKGKLQELRQLLSELPFVISDLEAFSSIQAIPEVGKTFVENASLKASGYAKQTGRLTLADDSGLEVDALNGAPGVLSARYAHEGASDVERTTKLLTEMSQLRESQGSICFGDSNCQRRRKSHQSLDWHLRGPNCPRASRQQWFRL